MTAMPRRRSPRDLAHVADRAWEALSLPERQKRALVLEHAWRRVAGEAVARRAAAAGVARGVLRVEVPDPRWATALRGLLPGLVARMARSYPELGVRRFRIVAAGAEELPRPVPESPQDDAPATSAPTPSRPGEVRAADPAPAGVRIEAIADAYLARFEGRPGRPKR